MLHIHEPVVAIQQTTLDTAHCLLGLLYRDRISEVERNEVDYFGRIRRKRNQVERTEIVFGKTVRVEIYYPISRIETALRIPACKNLMLRSRSETVAIFWKFSQFDTIQAIYFRNFHWSTRGRILVFDLRDSIRIRVPFLLTDRYLPRCYIYSMLNHSTIKCNCKYINQIWS